MKRPLARFARFCRWCFSPWSWRIPGPRGPRSCAGGAFGPSPGADNRFRHCLRAGVDPGRDPARLTCEVAIPAWQEGSLVLAGASGGRSRHLRCRFDGNPACEFLVTWD